MNVRLLVVSDLHAHQGDPDSPEAPSCLSIDPAYANELQSPLLAISTLITENGLAPDVLICPGDIADRCNPIALSETWRRINEIKIRHKVPTLLGTVGNHDLDSRGKRPGRLPESDIKGLNPRFPVKDKKLWEQYWLNGFAQFRPDPNWQILIVNSCLFHGLAKNADIEAEYLRGRLPKDVIDRLRAHLRNGVADTNMLVIHHHVRKHPWRTHDGSHIENGPTLLKVLEDTGRQWLVIHGHEHLPDVSYSSGGSLAPIVFSAGSLAARTYEVEGKRPRNQAYFLELFDSASAAPANLRGIIRAWDWTPHVGWTKANRTSGLPWTSGFGTKLNVGETLNAVSRALDTMRKRQAEWPDLLEHVQDLKYVTADDLEVLIEALAAKHIKVSFDRFGVPDLIRRVK